MTHVAVIDYGMGNLRSVAKALEHVAPSAQVELTADPARIAVADRIVFPGQGAIGDAMRELHSRGLAASQLSEWMAHKPFLGICLGLQVLTRHSEEDGGTDGLALLAGQVVRFPDARRDLHGQLLKVPHMGWNTVHQTLDHPLWRDIDQDSRFYFVHSYYVTLDQTAECAGTTDYGLSFVSAAARDNLFAVQFHPEKSQHAGLTLLRNFMQWDGVV